jgi:hypothetical protein
MDGLGHAFKIYLSVRVETMVGLRKELNGLIARPHPNPEGIES